jgi:hypothetical protein
MNLNRYSTHVLCFFLQKERSEKRMAKKERQFHMYQMNKHGHRSCSLVGGHAMWGPSIDASGRIRHA